MNWSRVKTVLIILFLCTDIFLLATYLTSKYASSTISPEVIEATVDVLASNDITVDPSIIPQKIPGVMSFEAENVIFDYEAFAKSILGEKFTQTESGYEGVMGTISFSGDRFDFIRNPVLDAHADAESLNHGMNAVIVSSDISLLILRKELHEVTHIHKGHVQLVWSLRHYGLLASELCHAYSFLPQVDGENLHCFRTSISESLTYPVSAATSMRVS